MACHAVNVRIFSTEIAIDLRRFVCGEKGGRVENHSSPRRNLFKLPHDEALLFWLPLIGKVEFLNKLNSILSLKAFRKKITKSINVDSNSICLNFCLNIYKSFE